MRNINIMQFKRRLVGRQVSLLSMLLFGSTWQRHLADKNCRFKTVFSWFLKQLILKTLFILSSFRGKKNQYAILIYVASFWLNGEAIQINHYFYLIKNLFCTVKYVSKQNNGLWIWRGGLKGWRMVNTNPRRAKPRNPGKV